MATPRAAEHRDLEQRLRNLESTVRELTGAALRRRQLAVTEGDFVVSGGGNIVILGTDGTPVWDALSGPVKVATNEATATGFTVNTTLATKATASLTVPEGYTQALLVGTVEVCARNTTAGLDYLYAGTYGALTDVQPGTVGQVTQTDVYLETGKTGGDVVSMPGKVQSGGAAWGSDPFNAMTVHLLAIFLR